VGTLKSEPLARAPASKINVAILWCIRLQRSNDPKRVWELYDRLQADGLKPDKFTFNALFTVCPFDSNPWVRGISLLDRMEATGVAPDTVCDLTSLELTLTQTIASLSNLPLTRSALSSLGLEDIAVLAKGGPWRKLYFFLPKPISHAVSF
jgi:hypothetical protein